MSKLDLNKSNDLSALKESFNKIIDKKIADAQLNEKIADTSKLSFLTLISVLILEASKSNGKSLFKNIDLYVIIALSFRACSNLFVIGQFEFIKSNISSILFICDLSKFISLIIGISG